MSSSATAAAAIVAKFSVKTSTPGNSGAGIPRGTSPTVDTPRSARSSQLETTSPPTTSTNAPGTFGAANRSTRIVASDTPPTSSVVRCNSSRDEIQSANSRQTFFPDTSVPVSFGSSPTTTSIAAPNRKPVITAFDKNREIQPILKTASSTKSTPAISVTAATSCGASSAGTPVVMTALAATAANAALGPVEICRDVPNRA